MSRTKSPVTRSSKVALIVCLGFLLSLAVAFGATINRSAPQTALAGGRPASTIPRAANSSRVHKMAAPLLTTQPDAQFDITQNLIAGGGDASAAGQFGIDGNLGEPTAGTVMSGGNFKQAGGFEFATSTGPLPDATPGTPIVISEFRTRAVSGANDEFVELYNNTDAPIDLSGWVIKASNNAGAVSNRLTINAGTTIPARKHFLAVNSLGYSGVVTGDQAYPTGITDDGGIAIFDSANVLIDQVGMNPGSAFKEGTTLTPFNSGDTSDRSYERLPGGASGSTQDTDDNGADFVLVTPSSPQNLASLSTPSSGGQPSLVISQIYTDGGNSGATYTNDFIEIFNRGDATVDFSTTPYSVQYASATGAFSSNKTDLIIGTVAPGRYFLIQEGSNGSVGVPLPQPDVTGTINLSASAGKVSLVASLSTLPAVTCPGDDGISPFNPGLAGISDFVGYGAGTNCFEGSGVAAAPSAALATFRNSSGCADTNDNAADFAAAAANPRNSTIAVNTCSAAPSPTPTPTPTPTPANCVRVTVPAGLSAINNTLLSVPINVNDTTGKEIVSFDFKLNYDPSVLTPAVLPSQSDTLSGEFTITTNNATPGHLVVSGFGTQPLSGAGTLLKLNFNVIGAEPACSDLTLSPFTFNEGVPCATMIDGDVCVTKGTIAGSINYGNENSSRPGVANVTLTGVGSPNVNTTSASDGSYALVELGGGAYVVTPSKTGEVNGITSFDASLAAQNAIQLIALGPNQQIAADVSNNGVVTSFDAALIAQTVVGLPNDGIAGTWKFLPASRSYPTTTADQIDQDYDAILMGDVSGNWTPAGGGGVNSRDAGTEKMSPDTTPISVSLPNTTNSPGMTSVVPISVGDVRGQGIISYQFDLTFNPDILQPQAQPVSASNTLSSSMTVITNAGTRGHLQVAAFGTAPLSGAGTLINLRFAVIGSAGMTTALSPRNFAFNEGKPGTSVTDGAFAVQAVQANVVQFNSTSLVVSEEISPVTVTVNRLGDLSGPASVEYATMNGTATDRGDYIAAFGKLIFAPGEASRSFIVLINQDSFVEGPETFNVVLSNPTGMVLGGPSIATIQITDGNERANNTLDDARSYVTQQYHDFLNRQPDPSGGDFWTNQISSCGNDAGCLEVKRINVSAAFFLSIEFQDTGYLIERIYKTAYGNAVGTSTFPAPHQLAVPVVRLNELLADSQEIGQNVIVNQGNWQKQLEDNKQAFAAEFVQRSRFINAFPLALTPAQFVDTLNANAGSPLSQTERDQLVNDLQSNVRTRAQALREVAEHPNLKAAEFNRAFVLMQYFGYLRRNPNDPQDSDYSGYDFWLTKLNQQEGNYIDAEMVKAFISSVEYRSRFGR